MPNATLIPLLPATLGGLLDDLEDAARAYADAQQRRAEIDVEKAAHEAALVNALVGNANPMTNKPHSASSAAEAASQDERTVQYRRERIDAERALTLAEAAYTAAKVRAWSFANHPSVAA